MFPLDERFSQALQGSARGWRQALDRHLRQAGLSQAGWRALAAAAAADRPLSQTELAHRLGVEGATLVATVDRLVRDGMIERVTSPIDRRIKQLVLTAPGRALNGRVQQEAAAWRSLLLVDVDQARIAIATQVLEQLQHILEDRG